MKACQAEIKVKMEHPELTGNRLYRQIEENYWSYHREDSGVTVEYANDIPVDKFSSGFPITGEYADHSWNMNAMNLKPGTLLQFWKNKSFSGITKPWVYISHPYSSFCWHYEDMMMYSINYMHEGAGKVWYVIPDSQRTNFEKYARKRYRQIFWKDPAILTALNLQISPVDLARAGVKVYRTIQKQGEFILTFPGSYHSGVSVGYTMAEAINFTSSSWLKHCEKSIQICKNGGVKRPIFPMEWMIIENIKNFDSINLDLASKKEIFKYFEKWLKVELKERQLVFQELGQKVKDVEPYIFSFKNRKNIQEDRFEWAICTNLCYMSIIKWTDCKIIYCLSHGICCECNPKSLKLILRYSSDELLSLKASSKAHILRYEKGHKKRRLQKV